MSTNSRKVRASRFSPAGTLAASVLAILATAADAQAVTEWDLPGQPLAKSLREIAAQSESNIIFDKKLVSGQQARPLKTKASAEQALSQVLEGTGLTYRQLDDKTVSIQLASTDPMATTSATYNNERRIRLAQAQTAQGGDQGGRQTRMVDGRQLLDIEEIIVTGTNIRGIENSTVPVIVLDREYIQSSGISTTTRLIESLPQNFALSNQSNTTGIATASDPLTQGSAVNLRGIGDGTTLVLVNGRRLANGFQSAAVDISALPISAIERVEVLTDGASALYGSDAVGGVVNFILRSDFEGAETRIRGGAADGTDEYAVSQVVGSAWDSGNALFSVEYYKRDLLLASDRDFVPRGPGGSDIGSLLPEDENYSAMFTGRQDLSSSVSVFADALYTYRDSFNTAGQQLQNESTSSENPQYSATLGLDWRLGESWQIEASGTYANYDLEQIGRSDSPFLFGPVRTNREFTIEAGRIKADGSLFAIGGGNVSAAIGVDWRSESYQQSQSNSLGPQPAASADLDQDVSSAFGELFIPLVGEGNAMPGIHRLEVSLAARYDDYSEFGSSFDPKYGFSWQPVAGVKLRGSFGTSYVAPRLTDYSLTSSRGLGLRQPDPTVTVPPGLSSQILLLGTDVASLKAQESDNLSLGLEFTPLSLTGLQVGVNYYDIEYTDRIAAPPPGAVLLGNPAAFGSLFIRNPTPAQIAEAMRLGSLGGFPFQALPGFDPTAVAVIVDGRRRNLSETNTSGLDLSTRYAFDVGSNNFNIGVAGTYVFELEQRVTSTSPEVDTIETYANPPHWRARASFGWQHGGLSTNLFVNHTDSYTDTRVALMPQSIDSYTTVDLRVAYDFSARFKDGLLSGVTIAAGALNLADEDPPQTRALTALDLGFDPTNASPLGRLISIELMKTW